MGYGNNNGSYDRRNNNRNNGHNNNRNFSGGKPNNFKPVGPIKSPYNFVPLSPIVIFPGWAGQVSHDIPFKDGISGKIDLEVTLKSDTYIKDSEEGSEKFFKATFINKDGKPEEKFVIPGTSFKGMIRNVLEIATLGKMQKFNDDRYSIRDLNNSNSI